jgi:hypothetical protein
VTHDYVIERRRIASFFGCDHSTGHMNWNCAIEPSRRTLVACVGARSRHFRQSATDSRVICSLRVIDQLAMPDAEL